MLVPEGWSARVDPSQAVVLTTTGAASAPGTERRMTDGRSTPGLEDEVVRYGLTAAAEEAAIAVVRAARSQFIVEGSDAGAAILDRHAESSSPRRRRRRSCTAAAWPSSSWPSSTTSPIESMRPDDVFITNDPYRGGVHANDVMLCRPVFVDGTVRYFTASLIHVLDLGGAAHGGINAQAMETFEEGVQIPPMHWRARGRPQRGSGAARRAQQPLPRRDGR